ncbi:GNAT family N-acetyltransferase [Paenibacillus glycanilyticus]|uniref:Acetyltransferase n=1 Tax=Paenibacillus glycanilyticus TaxID=126569 RepID=A0ABQ6NL19_9BACL|nr:GNAT family N-acetyltransferase [Paenibacillus glycanilyticus]GMK44820.1 putative acetyltransferase [Paenibacillus glycanilyticus]
MNPTKIATPEELESAFSIRKKVFVEEQGVPLADEFDEFDRLDGKCEHILAYYDGEAVGTGRIRTVEGMGKLERICLLEPYRKFGIGRQIIAALEEIALEKGLPKVKLHGQTHAKGFYEKLGYEGASDEFMEDGIPHVLMTKSIK